jgi:hypothetical protein
MLVFFVKVVVRHVDGDGLPQIEIIMIINMIKNMIIYDKIYDKTVMDCLKLQIGRHFRMLGRYVHTLFCFKAQIKHTIKYALLNFQK